jgi:hypothetical protein
MAVARVITAISGSGRCDLLKWRLVENNVLTSVLSGLPLTNEEANRKPYRKNQDENHDSLHGHLPCAAILLWAGGLLKTTLWLEWDSSAAGRLPLGFTEQKMNMLRHDYIPINLKPETAPHPLQG